MMQKKFRNLSLFCLLILFTLCSLPVILFSIKLSAPFNAAAQLIILSISFIILITSLSAYLPRFIALLLSFFALLALIEVWVITDYGNVIDSNFLGILVETSTGETTGFLTKIPLWVPLSILVTLLVSIFYIIFPFRTNKKLSQYIFFLSFFVLVAQLCYLQYSAKKNETEGAETLETHALFLLKRTPEDMILRQAYPTGLLFVLQDFIYQRQELKFAINFHKDFRFNAQRNEKPEQRQIYILVIGESSAAAHWSINGYPRNTNPLLSARGDIINFNEMYTFANATRIAVPLIISRKPFYDPRSVFPETSIVSYFKELGFKTVWISMQAKFGFNDSPISVSAFEADDVIFMNPANIHTNAKPDYESIPEIKHVIDSTDGDIFIVVHTLGSHIAYEQRYDDKARVFTPDHINESSYNLRFGMSVDQDRYDAMVNAYDNSIVATDYFLNGIIDLLSEQKSTDSWMLYISDHGQALGDDCTGMFAHGFMAPNVNHIPAVFWASETYQKKHPEKLGALQSHANKQLSSTMMFNTMVGLSGGYIPDETRIGYDLTQEAIVEPEDLVFANENNLFTTFCQEE